MSVRVTVVGAGNLGVASAVRMAAKGIQVTLYTRSPERWPSMLLAEDCRGRVFSGEISLITSDPQRAADADLILLCVPGNVMSAKLSEFRPYLVRGTAVASIFSGDGFFFVAEKVLGSDWPVMGFQRVPVICRMKEPFRTVSILGYRAELSLAGRCVDDLPRWRAFFEDVFATKTTLLENYLDAAYANGNVVLHPARLMSLAAQINANGRFDGIPLFYEEWDDCASVWAIRLDEEVRAVASAKGAHVMPILEYYASVDEASLTRKIRSIAAFKGIGSPIAKDGQIDCSSRYIQADVHVALANIVREAMRDGINCPFAKKVLERFGACCESEDE